MLDLARPSFKTELIGCRSGASAGGQTSMSSEAGLGFEGGDRRFSEVIGANIANQRHSGEVRWIVHLFAGDCGEFPSAGAGLDRDQFPARRHSGLLPDGVRRPRRLRDPPRKRVQDGTIRHRPGRHRNRTMSALCGEQNDLAEPVEMAFSRCRTEPSNRAPQMHSPPPTPNSWPTVHSGFIDRLNANFAARSGAGHRRWRA